MCTYMCVHVLCRFGGDCVIRSFILRLLKTLPFNREIVPEELREGKGVHVRWVGEQLVSL